MIRICMIGHGMMGTWHSDGLKNREDAILHTIVGKERDAVSGFARHYGYRNVSTNWAAAIGDPDVDAVIIASPSEMHAEMALAAIAAGKPLLVEIPVAMTLRDAERVVEAAEAARLPLAICHPMRFRTARAALIGRIGRGEERPRHVAGRVFMHRLVNIGATGIRRDWTDNILWHHSAHLVDFGLFVIGGGDPVAAEAKIRRIEGFMPDADPATGIPMEVAIVIETHEDQTILVTGSYYARERIYDTLIVTDHDSYRADELAATLTTGAGTEAMQSEAPNAWRVANDFLDALRDGRPPFVTGRSVLPAMRVLDAVQRGWDARFGARSLPGRPLDDRHDIGQQADPIS
jgi:2-hydroxy-4-carboxymuconate semialdehyde hemiacetal dehydrogenase